MLGEEKLDAVICVAGGWAGGSAKSKSKIVNIWLFHKIFMPLPKMALIFYPLHTYIDYILLQSF